MKTFYVITGILGLLSIFVPDLITMGLYLFVVPGVLLAVSPSLFVLTFILRTLRALLKRFSVPFPLIASIGLIVALCYAVALAYNAPTQKMVEELTAHDVITQRPIPVSGTVALLGLHYFNNRNNKWQYLCNDMCMKLLYNGAAKKILIGPADDIDNRKPRDTKLQSFFIEKRDVCPTPLLDWSNSNDTTQALMERIMHGECLITSDGDISEANIVISDKTVHRSPYISDKLKNWYLNLDSLTARRFEVIRVSPQGQEVLEQRTQTRSMPLFVPLVIFPTFSGINAHQGFLRIEDTRNPYDDGLHQLSDYYATLFGPAYQTVTGLEHETFGADLAKAFGNPAYEQELKAQAFDIFLFQFEPVFRKDKNAHPTESDIAIIAKAIQDPDVRLSYRLAGLKRINTGKVDLNLLIEPLFNRFVQSEYKDKHALSTLKTFSKEELAPHNINIEEIEQQHALTKTSTKPVRIPIPQEIAAPQKSQ